MPATPLPKWWAALGSARWQGSTRAAWREALGDEEALVERFLVARGTVAMVTRRTPDRLLRRYRVVIHAREDIVGMVDDDGDDERVRLTRDDIVCWEVDWSAVHRSLVAGLDLEAGITPIGDIAGAWTLGRCRLSDERTVPVQLMVGDARYGERQAAVFQLISQATEPCIILVATSDVVPSTTWAVARARSCSIVPLTRLGIDAGRRLVAPAGIDSVVGDLRLLIGTPAIARTGYRFLLQDGDTLLAWAGDERSITGQTKGMGYLHALLAREGTPIPVEGLVGAVNGVDPAALRGSRGVKADRQSRQALRQHIDQLDAQMREAASAGNDGVFDQLQATQQRLQAHLDADEGFAGRDQVLSDLDGHRISVKQAIDRAVAQIGQRLPAMAQHLRQFIQTGLKPSYRPPESERRAWET